MIQFLLISCLLLFLSTLDAIRTLFSLNNYSFNEKLFYNFEENKRKVKTITALLPI